MPKKKTKKKSVKKKRTTNKKSNIVKIQVEAKSPRRRASKPRVSTQKVQIQMQPILVENFVSLQKVMMNLAEKLEGVSTKIATLLEIFEASAKTLAKKDFKLAGETNPEVLRKLNNLEEQNKIIARGLTLLHEPTPMPIVTPPLPTPKPSIPIPPKKTVGKEEYKKSTSFKPLKPKTSE